MSFCFLLDDAKKNGHQLLTPQMIKSASMSQVNKLVLSDLTPCQGYGAMNSDNLYVLAYKGQR